MIPVGCSDESDPVELTGRENTGAGRYTDLDDAHQKALVDGHYDARKCMIAMEGLPVTTGS